MAQETRLWELGFRKSVDNKKKFCDILQNKLEPKRLLEPRNPKEVWGHSININTLGRYSLKKALKPLRYYLHCAGKNGEYHKPLEVNVNIGGKEVQYLFTDSRQHHGYGKARSQFAVHPIVSGVPKSARSYKTICTELDKCDGLSQKEKREAIAFRARSISEALDRKVDEQPKWSASRLMTEQQCDAARELIMIISSAETAIPDDEYVQKLIDAHGEGSSQVPKQPSGRAPGVDKYGRAILKVMGASDFTETLMKADAESEDVDIPLVEEHIHPPDTDVSFSSFFVTHFIVAGKGGTGKGRKLILGLVKDPCSGCDEDLVGHFDEVMSGATSDTESRSSSGSDVSR